MANTKNSTDQIWKVDSTGVLETTGCTVTHIFFFPSANAEDIVFTDTGDNELFGIKGNSGNTDMIPVDFGWRGRKFSSLKVGTLDGTSYAYVFLRKLS